MSDDKKSKTPKDTHYANLRRAFRDQKAGGNKTDGGKFGGSKPRGAPGWTCTGCCCPHSTGSCNPTRL